MASQTASGPLYTSQQFYLGGAAFGRGYGAAELSGDNGLAGSFELRFDQRPNIRYLAGYQLYGFVDAGAVWNDGFRLGDGLALTSAGGGIRFFFWDDFQADIGVAFPLSYRAPDNSTRTARLLFSISNALKLCPERGTGTLPLIPWNYAAWPSPAIDARRRGHLNARRATRQTRRVEHMIDARIGAAVLLSAIAAISPAAAATMVGDAASTCSGLAGAAGDAVQINSAALQSPSSLVVSERAPTPSGRIAPGRSRLLQGARPYRARPIPRRRRSNSR